MNRLIACMAAAAIAGTLLAETAGESVPKTVMIDGVAAYVNSEMITVADVMKEVRRSPYAENSSKITQTLLYKLYRDTLNALIDRKLILLAAGKGKLQLQPWAIDNRIREIIEKNFGNDRAKLNLALADRKISYEEWRKTIEEDLLVSAMRYQNVEKKISPTPSEVRAEYEKNRTRYQTETATAVSMIILDPPAQGEESVVMRAGEIKKALEAGESFASLAKKYSKDAKAANGGSWGKVNPDDVFRPEIAEAVSKLAPGETSDAIILDGYGYIVRKDEQQDARILTFEEAVPYVESRLRMETAEKLYKEWTDRMRAEAYIKIFELPGSGKQAQ